MREDNRSKEALDVLERAARDSETLGTSSLGRLGRRAADHFVARDAIAEGGGNADPI